MMRAMILGLSLFGLVDSALAESVGDRLGRLEYETRMQRIDLDAVQRQQAIDAVDARDRADRADFARIEERLRRGPAGDSSPSGSWQPR